MQKHPEPGKLKSLFDYNPQTGDIHWRQTRRGRTRDVSVRVNTENQREAQSRNTHSRPLGASWRPTSGVWVARIRVAGREQYLGAFASDVDAHAAYVAAKRSLHAGCSI